MTPKVRFKFRRGMRKGGDGRGDAGAETVAGEGVVGTQDVGGGGGGSNEVCKLGWRKAAIGMETWSGQYLEVGEGKKINKPTGVFGCLQDLDESEQNVKSDQRRSRKGAILLNERSQQGN